ncbi:hypothetical protein [Brucella anthropi]|uniref:hypothetical protein n=1 Tax=Brucella anthropi TaxID=529 RepID=UPI003D96F731
MASEDLLKKAFAAFNALSPEQQAEMLEEQRQSWMMGNIGLSRDERGITSPAMREVENRLTPLIKAVNSWADRTSTPVAPAATDTGLVTVAYGNFREPDGALVGLCEEGNPNWTGSKPLCDLSQAEELLAAERARSVYWAGQCGELFSKVEDLKADNAAQAARIKEYETGLVDFHREVSDLEAKLAAANGTINQCRLAFAGQVSVQSAIEKIDARAVLGGKPSSTSIPTQKTFEVYGPYTPVWIGAGVWAGIKEELPPQLVDKEVWISTADPREVQS